jgi:hypothetical protein
MLGEAALNPAAFGWMWAWFTENLEKVEALPPSYVQGIIVRLVPLSGIGYHEQVKSCLDDFVARHPKTTDSIRMAMEFLAVNEKLAGVNHQGEI